MKALLEASPGSRSACVPPQGSVGTQGQLQGQAPAIGSLQPARGGRVSGAWGRGGVPLSVLGNPLPSPFLHHDQSLGGAWHPGELRDGPPAGKPEWENVSCPVKCHRSVSCGWTTVAPGDKGLQKVWTAGPRDECLPRPRRGQGGAHTASPPATFQAWLHWPFLWAGSCRACPGGCCAWQRCP